jgi:outer membrane protein assembly factor BamB
MSTPIVYRGLLYIPNGGGRLTTYDASTGEPVYRARFSRGGGFTGSPVAADGRLYFPNQELGDRVASRDSRQAAAGFYALHR